jgi:hypothetical protein
MKIVASPDTNAVSVNTPSQIEGGFIAKHSFSCRVLKEHYSKMYSKVLRLGLLYIAVVGRVL